MFDWLFLPRHERILFQRQQMWWYPVTASPTKAAALSCEDVERIAVRVAELLKKDK